MIHKCSKWRYFHDQSLKYDRLFYGTLIHLEPFELLIYHTGVLLLALSCFVSLLNQSYDFLSIQSVQFLVHIWLCSCCYASPFAMSTFNQFVCCVRISYHLLSPYHTTYCFLMLLLHISHVFQENILIFFYVHEFLYLFSKQSGDCLVFFYLIVHVSCTHFL